MLFTQWLNELTDRVLRKRTGKFARKARKVSRNVPNSSEVLETRVVPTIDVTLTAGALVITGTAAANNLTVSATGGTYTLSSSSDTIAVTDDTATATGSGSGIVTIGGGVSGNVTSVSIDLGAGNNDKLTILSADDDAITAAGGDNSGDTIQGPNATTTWTIDAANSLVVSGQTVTFTGGRTGFTDQLSRFTDQRAGFTRQPMPSVGRHFRHGISYNRIIVS